MPCGLLLRPCCGYSLQTRPRRLLTSVACSRREAPWPKATRSPRVRRATVAAPGTAVALEACSAGGGRVLTLLEEGGRATILGGRQSASVASGHRGWL